MGEHQSVNGLELLYRGSLKSCNYRCSYCPFSRHRMSDRELMKDREQWEQFTETVCERAEALKIRSLMVTPYGEALIYPWYWEGLGKISGRTEIEAVGAQTNLSFSVPEALERFRAAGGNRNRLHLWATFHPEMTTAEKFSETCRKLAEMGIRLCAGAVGVPQNIKLLQDLRRSLPREVYLWINRMDGLKRPYTQEEIGAFLEIDPYFLRELDEPVAEPKQCRNRLFVEGNGRVRTCNISRNPGWSWDGLWEQFQKKELPDGRPEPVCGRKRCTCYLAYGGRDHFMNRILFGPCPVFRIPGRAKAVFLDIAGTLTIPGESGRGRVAPWVRAGLEGLSRSGVPLFFATTLPYRDARRRCREIWHLFSGGIFAGGAHVVLHGPGGNRESVQVMEESCLPVLEAFYKNRHCRFLSYRTGEGLYKITLLRPGALHWKEEEKRAAEEQLEKAGIDGVRVLLEDNCLQVLSERATKAEGVRRICGWLSISPEETAAAGDSPEDTEMQKICRSPYFFPKGQNIGKPLADR